MSDDDVAVAEELRALDQWVEQVDAASGRLAEALLGLAQALEMLRRDLEGARKSL